jgi:hypothetical protein
MKTKTVQVILTLDDGKQLNQWLRNFDVEGQCPVADHYNQDEQHFRQWLLRLADYVNLTEYKGKLIKASTCFINFAAREIPPWYRQHCGRFIFE